MIRSRRRRVAPSASLLLALSALAVGLRAVAADFVPVPPRAEHVVDLAGILPPGHERAITALAAELKRKTGAEIAVLTQRSVAPEDPFTYGMRVVDAWKLGEAEKENGLLLLVAVDDRRMQFLTGYGLEGILPDGRLGEISDRYIVPRFKLGDFGGGVQAGLRAAADVIAADAGVVLSGEPARPVRAGRRRGGPNLPWLLFVFVVIVIVTSSGRHGPRGRRRGRHYHPVFWGGGFGGGRGGFGGGGFGGGLGGGGGFGGGGVGRGW